MNEQSKRKSLVDFVDKWNAPRPEVEAFGFLMEQILRKNDHKRGWKNLSLEWLLNKLREEVNELEVEINRFKPTESKIREAVCECVDVANVAMMIADVLASNLNDGNRGAGSPGRE